MDIKQALSDILLKSLDFDQVVEDMSSEDISVIVHVLNMIEEKLIKADDNLYHIHVGGYRVSDKPMSISDIEAQHGSVKELESNSEVKLVPHTMKKIEFNQNGQWSLDKQERWSGKPAPTLDYAVMNKPKGSSGNERTLDYSQFNKPKGSSGNERTLDYSQFNKPKPQETEQVLDYSKLNDPSAQKPTWKTKMDPQKARETWNRINRQRREQVATGVIKDK